MGHPLFEKVFAMPSENYDILLTLKEVAVILGNSLRTVYRLIKPKKGGDGQNDKDFLRSIKIRGSRRVRKSDLEDYITRHRT